MKLKGIYTFQLGETLKAYHLAKWFINDDDTRDDKDELSEWNEYREQQEQAGQLSMFEWSE